MAAVITFEGFRTTARTRDMLIEARRITKAPLRVTQGGFNAGGVAASAGTHDRDALDIRARDLTTEQKAEAVLRLRQVGFAAWVRNPSQSNWPWHIHCIPIGGDISAGAAKQVTDYMNGRNGLASHGKDDGPRLYIQTWETYLKKRGPLPPTKPQDATSKPSTPTTTPEDTLSQQEVNQINTWTEKRLQAYASFIVLNKDQTVIPALAKVQAGIDVLAEKLGVSGEVDKAQSAALAGLQSTADEIKQQVQGLVNDPESFVTQDLAPGTLPPAEH